MNEIEEWTIEVLQQLIDIFEKKKELIIHEKSAIWWNDRIETYIKELKSILSSKNNDKL